MQREWDDIKQQLAGGIPVAVCMLSDESATPSEHFRLLVGFDSERRTVVFHDPAVTDGKYMTMSLDVFAKLWPLKDGRGGRMLVRFHLPAPASARIAPEESFEWTAPGEGNSLTARRDATAAALPSKLGREFTISTEGPFVVAGDMDAAALARFQEGTIRWAHEKLKTDFFDAHGLDRPITIYLFKDDRSYRENASKLFGDSPDTPYGY
jgi:hypothetical protein